MTRTLIVPLLALAALAVPAQAQQYAQTVEVKIPALPTTVEEFTALANRLTGPGTDASLFVESKQSFANAAADVELGAFGGAASFVVAGIILSQNQELGLQCITIALHPERRQKSTKPGNFKGFLPTNMDVQRLKERWTNRKAYVPRSYVKGTSPGNQYTLPQGPFSIVVKRQAPDASGKSGLKVFIPSSGADSARPIKLKADGKGRWKTVEFSSLTSGCRPPEQAPDPDSDF